MNIYDINPPALVRQVNNDLFVLAKKINAEHEAGALTIRKGLEHYRQAGAYLLQVKRQVGHGNFGRWLEENVSFHHATATKYMKVADNWSKLSPTLNLTEALRELEPPPLPIAVKPRPAPAPVVLDEEDDDDFPEEDVPEEDVPGIPHVARNTGENEWYTPPIYLAASRAVLGDIDLDPASSDKAQENVKAQTYYTKEDDGLTKDWFGRVYMNPPYQSGLIEQFTAKLAKHFNDGDVPSAIVLVNNATETHWFYELSGVASAVCFPEKRIKFLRPDGNTGSPLQGQAFLYLGDDIKTFVNTFNKFGEVWIK